MPSKCPRNNPNQISWGWIRHKTAQEASQPPLGAFWVRFWAVGARFWRFLAPMFFTLLKFVDFSFSATLALCWSTFFTRIWCWMGCWGYAKSQAFILFDLIRFEFYSLRGARILEPKTTTKFWSSRGLQKFVDVFGFQDNSFYFTWFALNFTHFYFEAFSSLESGVGLLGLRQAQRI